MQKEQKYSRTVHTKFLIFECNVLNFNSLLVQVGPQVPFHPTDRQNSYYKIYNTTLYNIYNTTLFLICSGDITNLNALITFLTL